jgi:hypothetical protein
MTIKEKLYKEYVIAKNKIKALCNEELIGGDNIEEYFNSSDFSRDAKCYTKDDIKRMIYNAEIVYQNEVNKLRLENYYKTEEGKAEKEKLNKQIREFIDRRHDLVISTTKKVDLFIKEWLGDIWGCGLVGNSCLEIGMVEKVAENKANHFYFGHSFNLYYNDIFDEDRFDMNYGCMGAFSLLGKSKETKLRSQFLIGMGKFSTDQKKLSDLKKILNAFCIGLKEYSTELDNLRDKLNNPFNKK